MSEKPVIYSSTDPVPPIVTIRGQKVILDSALAGIYGVETKRLNEQVKRNADRFPADFIFRLSPLEVANLKSQIATSSSQHVENKGDSLNWPKIATSSIHGGRRKLPVAFTEHGAIVDTLRRLMEIIDPPALPEPPKKQIGFRVKEPRAVYRASPKGRRA